MIDIISLHIDKVIGAMLVNREEYIAKVDSIL